MASTWTGKPCVGCDGRKGKKYASRKFCGRCSVQVRAANKAARHAARIEQTYGITGEEYQKLLAFQGGTCVLCQRATGKSKRLAVDHDHATGVVRGLLCSTCNNILGHARDDTDFFDRCISYLRFPPTFQLAFERRIKEKTGE